MTFLGGFLVAFVGSPLVADGASDWPAAGAQPWGLHFDNLRAFLAEVGFAVAGIVAALCAGLWFALRMLRESAAEAKPAETKTRTPQALKDTGVRMEQELAAVLGLMRGYMEMQTQYAESLTRAQAQLNSVVQPDQVWTIVKLLIADNEKVRRDADEMRSKLERSRAQIDELQSSLAVAEETALRDPLTSLGNRRLFDTTLAEAISSAHETKTALCLVLGDVDEFKKLNDKLGHSAGDQILKQFAELLVRNVKGRDYVARIGGEEFAIVLPQTAMGNAYHLTERIRKELEASRWVIPRTGQPAGRLTASFGIAQLKDGDDPAALIDRADAKLYDAKRDGRNRIAIERSAA
jgi:diguanylate cyclase